jgi:hypothetical protein
MGLKLGPSHFGKDIDLRVFENSAVRKQQDARENCIRWNFIIILLS